MSFFVVNKCETKACLNWRRTDKCAKNGFSMQNQLKFISFMQNEDICKIRKQLNEYRLKQLLEEQ